MTATLTIASGLTSAFMSPVQSPERWNAGSGDESTYPNPSRCSIHTVIGCLPSLECSSCACETFPTPMGRRKVEKCHLNTPTCQD